MRPLFGMHRTVWPDEPAPWSSTSPHGDWIRLFRDSGFEVEELRRAPGPGGRDDPLRSGCPHAWARQWPCEEVWKVRKRG